MTKEEIKIESHRRKREAMGYRYCWLCDDEHDMDCMVQDYGRQYICKKCAKRFSSCCVDDVTGVTDSLTGVCSRCGKKQYYSKNGWSKDE